MLYTNNSTPARPLSSLGICPNVAGFFLAEDEGMVSIPNCTVTFYPQDGHISLIANHLEEMLTAMIS